VKFVIFGISCFLLFVAFLFASAYYKDYQEEKFGFMAQKNVTTFIRAHSQSMGSEDAKVIIVEFMDPACETCAAFTPFVKQMMSKNFGKIKLVLRYAPFHDGAEYFVKILEASRKQDKYWQTLDVMYKTQPQWASHNNPQPQKIWQFLPNVVGLNIEQLKKDMNDPAIAELIAQDLADAKTLQVTKTPGFFVNGKPLQQFGYRQLQELIETELGEQYQN
jgi:protein-disulfide isomerase